MSRYPMDRYNEERLIQEVVYLHSLWHQGPPNRPHPTTPIPTPVSLQPSSSTQFKKKKKKKKSKADSGIEWPVPTPTNPSPINDSGWPSLAMKPTPQPHFPSSNELARFASNHAHQQALKAVSEYYSNNGDGDDDDDDEDVMETDDGLEQDYDFFVKLFEQDGSLREYYEKNREGGGEFSCLVCSGLGKKGWKKRFKDCVALVQHSTAIANTNHRQAHRAYGQVICKILGWDINRLPSIVLSAGGAQPVKGNEADGGKNGMSGLSNTTDGVNQSDEVSQLKESVSNENQQENGGGTTLLEGIVNDDGKDGLRGPSNTSDTANIGCDELSQQKEALSSENQQENGGSSTAVEVNVDDDGKNGSCRLSNTTDTANIGGDELCPPKVSFSSENQQENGVGSTAVESGANANRSLGDISSDNPEIAKENAEGATNCLEPLQENKDVANGDNDDISKETTIISDKS